MMNTETERLIIALLIGIILLSLGAFLFADIINDRSKLQTSPIDNGCSSKQELKQTKTNAETYNYAALSASY